MKDGETEWKLPLLPYADDAAQLSESKELERMAGCLKMYIGGGCIYQECIIFTFFKSESDIVISFPA